MTYKEIAALLIAYDAKKDAGSKMDEPIIIQIKKWFNEFFGEPYNTVRWNEQSSGLHVSTDGLYSLCQILLNTTVIQEDEAYEIITLLERRIGLSNLELVDILKKNDIRLLPMNFFDRSSWVTRLEERIVSETNTSQFFAEKFTNLLLESIAFWGNLRRQLPFARDDSSLERQTDTDLEVIVRGLVENKLFNANTSDALNKRYINLKATSLWGQEFIAKQNFNVLAKRFSHIYLTTPLDETFFIFLCKLDNDEILDILFAYYKMADDGLDKETYTKLHSFIAALIALPTTTTAVNFYRIITALSTNEQLNVTTLALVYTVKPEHYPRLSSALHSLGSFCTNEIITTLIVRADVCEKIAAMLHRLRSLAEYNAVYKESLSKHQAIIIEGILNNDEFDYDNLDDDYFGEIMTSLPNRYTALKQLDFINDEITRLLCKNVCAGWEINLAIRIIQNYPQIFSRPKVEIIIGSGSLAEAVAYIYVETKTPDELLTPDNIRLLSQVPSHGVFEKKAFEELASKELLTPNNFRKICSTRNHAQLCAMIVAICSSLTQAIFDDLCRQARYAPFIICYWRSLFKFTGESKLDPEVLSKTLAEPIACFIANLEMIKQCYPDSNLTNQHNYIKEKTTVIWDPERRNRSSFFSLVPRDIFSYLTIYTGESRFLPKSAISQLAFAPAFELTQTIVKSLLPEPQESKSVPTKTPTFSSSQS